MCLLYLFDSGSLGSCKWYLCIYENRILESNVKEVSQGILNNLIIYTQCGTYVYIIYRYMHKSKYSTTVLYMYVLTLCKRGIFASMKIRFVGSEQNDILYFSRGNVYTQELRCIKIMKLTKIRFIVVTIMHCITWHKRKFRARNS